MYVSTNVSIPKAAINVHVQRATIRLETNVQVNNFFNMKLDSKVASFQAKISVSVKKEGVLDRTHEAHFLITQTTV
jgi:hypothetical protein